MRIRFTRKALAQLDAIHAYIAQHDGPAAVFYTVDEAVGEVHILRIRHSAQDPERHLD